MDLTQWLVEDADDLAARLRGQVLAVVPAERWGEQPGGGSSIRWNLLHVGRHAALALRVLGVPAPEPAWVAALAGEVGPVAGLSEASQPWEVELPAAEVGGYLDGVLGAVAAYLAGAPTGLEQVPDSEAALAEAGIDVAGDYGWLAEMWAGKPVAWLIRWPLLGHVGNHVGEMIATRNRMGLSPF